MSLQDEIQTLINKVDELKKEIRENENTILRLEYIIDQIEKKKDELESCIEKLQPLQEEIQKAFTRRIPTLTDW